MRKVVQLMLVMVIIVELFGAIALIALAQEAPVFIEEFDNGSDNWTIQRETKPWQIEKGILTGEGYIVIGEDTWEDYHIQARMTTDGTDVGIVTRWHDRPDADHTYRFELHFGSQTIAIDVNKAPNIREVLVEKDYKLKKGKFYEVGAVCEGDKLEMYVDGKLELEVTDSTLKAGKVGLHCWEGKSQYDYFWINKHLQAVEPAGKITSTWAIIKSR